METLFHQSSNMQYFCGFYSKMILQCHPSVFLFFILLTKDNWTLPIHSSSRHSQWISVALPFSGDVIHCQMMPGTRNLRNQRTQFRFSFSTWLHLPEMYHTFRRSCRVKWTRPEFLLARTFGVCFFMLSSGKKTGRRHEYSLCKSLFSEVDINSLQWSVKSERYQESKFMSCIRLYFEIELFKKKKVSKFA